VSSELSLELAPDALTQITSAPELPVIGTGRPCGRKGPNALRLCEFTHRDSVVATATLRSFYIEASGNLAKRPEGPTGPLPPGSLADRMAVRVAEGGGAGKVLVQDSDPVLNNSLGIVHGGVSALELVGSAAVNENRDDRPLNTASLRVNFLRQFHTSADGPESRYEGTALRVGRNSGVAEARAVAADGKVAIIARLTAYLG
jgi:acyl-coenzyme A thioesterase PaaI-like protein